MQTLHRYRRRAKKSALQFRRRYFRHHPFVVPTAGFLLCFFILAAGFVAVNGQTVGANDSHIVSVYVDGQKRLIPTRAETVGELAKKLDIDLRPEDVVEPSADTPILEDNFKVTVYRAKPVTIVDGVKKIQVLSASEDPRILLQKAGVSVYPEDKVVSSRSEDLIHDGSLGDRYVIDRAIPLKLSLYGNTVDIRTRTKTVEDVLKEKNVQTVAGDTLLPAPTTPITPNMTVIVASNGKKIITVEETIPFETVTTQDPNVNAGTTNVLVKGANGKRIVTYAIDLQNDREVKRTPLQTVNVQEPVKQEVIKGTKVVISNPSANVELGRQIAIEMGVGDQFGCLYQLFDRESHWNHLARNGSGAYGIPQALPGSKMGPGWESDPAVQIRWGINYVKKYGGPCGAWNFWQVNHWY